MRIILQIGGGMIAALAAFPALATCPVANTYTHEFTTDAVTTLNYASSYNYTGTSPALGSQNVTVSWPLVNGTTSTVVAGLQMPRIDTIVNDGNPTTGSNLIVGMVLGGRTASITGGTRVVVTRFTFAAPVRTFTVQMNDIDFTASQFRDWLHISGSNGATVYTPFISTPVGTNNTTGAKTGAGSTIALGTATTPFSQTDREGIGTGNAPNQDDTGTMTAVFAQPVTQVELRYGNHPNTGGTTATGQQAFGIQRVSWCPMPSPTIVKTSAPYVTDLTSPDRFHIPGSDIAYTLTVTNDNSSPLDLNSVILTDMLPAGTVFRNADYDDAGPISTNFEFLPGTSGLTMSAGNLAYSNNGGTSYTYAPAAGYDSAINAIRINPQGTMAANSSFSIRFRTRIN